MTQRLETVQLINAYASGYFPMPEPKTEEIQWYFPDPRAVIPLDGFHCSKSLTKKINQGIFSMTLDQDFEGVMHGCANRKETWINEEFLRAYSELHRLGFAHSIEIWRAKKLVGGVYGVSIGAAFFAESKFHVETDASKVALYYLVQELNRRGFSLLEVQFLTPHLARLGAKSIPAEQYLGQLKKAVSRPQKW
ncbi:MAG: leucyl/phenylalanyl-tRNA--protein transferase [Proteobacteria bacterium]|nr:leucyl/phenylalanyl-tRNA--protein transferase [Pseudomonadota bacterium]NBY19262.1 leucyl/phenylalanyl-tRNA--protein transferase [bacterium]